MDKEKREETKKLINECLDEKLDKLANPEGYIKCQSCGKFIPKDTEKCPYCPVEPVSDPIDDKDKSGTMFDDL